MKDPTQLLMRITLLLPLGVAGRPAIADSPTFNRDVRPILSDKCFHCHGPDTNHREADLRLDLQESSHQYAIVPGNSDESEVYRRLKSDEPDLRMPPPESNKSLSQAEIELIRRWIDAGAKYQSHWAFITPARSPLPVVQQRDWIRNPIDAFVLARLEKAGLSPSPVADKNTLLRRVTLDLTGLPPTPGELESFLKDDSPDAYARVVDRLLDSESYGERMAQLWLDAARYADTMGYQADWERYQWRWRSWVIDAYNRNMPFDQFTIEQLAGDLLPNPSAEQMIATGFNRNHRINDEAGIIPQEYLVEYIVDRVETTGGTWMGLTIGCARCHDHKFDPISQSDFYRLFAFFNGVPEQGKEGRKGYATPYMRVAVRGKQAEYETVKLQVAEKQDALNSLIASLEAPRQEWIRRTQASLESAADPWTIALPSKVSANGPADFERLEDESYLVSGENLDQPTYLIELTMSEPTSVTGLRVEALTDRSLSGGSLSPGGGNFILTNFTVLRKSQAKKKPQRQKIKDARADYQQPGYPVGHAIDGDRRSGWGVDGNVKKEQRTAVFTLDKPAKCEPGDKLLVRMAFESDYPQRVIGRFRLSLTDTATPDFTGTLGIPRQLVDALRKPASERSQAQQQRIAEYHGNLAPETKDARDALAGARKALKQFEDQHTTYVMVMREMDTPRETFVLQRGVYNKPDKKVTAGVPVKLLGGLPDDAPPNRLGLARWLVSGEHPLTARVIVNRYWSMLFGNGLVETIEDFGLQGSYPSHPELLDWLASEYPRISWDTKQLLKLITTSATYQQASTVTPQLQQQDPHNRLLARMSRIRLPAETIRDQALLASGLMVHQIGGPSVKPYQPAGLWKDLSFQDKKRSTDFYEQDTGDGLYRRSIYTFWKRSVPPPAMATFDAPSREMCTLRRSRTNTPLQALALMNDTTYVEACRALAERAMTDGGDLDDQIRFAMRCLLSRDPDDAEARRLAEGFEKRREFFASNEDAARELIAQGDSKHNQTLDPVELATMTTCVMTVMNLDETVNRE